MRHRPAASLSDLLCRRLDDRAIAAAVDNDRCTIGRQPEGGGPPDILARPGNDRDLARERLVFSHGFLRPFPPRAHPRVFSILWQVTPAPQPRPPFPEDPILAWDPIPPPPTP